ncbi:uncharacterized protein LOC128789255 [Vidua chalybeata]|uniref:uncharacterized protein LOC128789255 n=1 Tax=Vidua chalybeata TaxID=81927 RepID=UPI0023A88014|nr:uncharacterized protein LOC128789255 [Vidua chalybeata]
MPGPAACHRGSKLLLRHRAALVPCRSRLSPPALPKALWRHRNYPSAPAGLSAVPLADAIRHLGTGSSAAPLEAPGIRLNRGFGSALVILPLSTQELPMAATRPQREGSVPDLAAVRCPGYAGCTPRAARSCSASEGEAALGRPLRSRLPPSLGGQLPPASRWPAAGPICSRGRLLLSGTAEPDGSGAEASEAALCQGAPDWLTGLRNGYLLRVKASDWPRGTCNASSEDAGVRVPERCRGAAAAPPGMAARSRRCPQHRPAPAALGTSGQHQQSQRRICRLFVLLQLAAIAIALLMSQSWQEEAVPQSVTSSEQGFYVKKRQKDKAAFLNPFPQHRVPEVQSVAEQTCLGCPSTARVRSVS